MDAQPAQKCLSAMLHAGLLRLLSSLHEVEAQTSKESVGGFLWVREHPAGFSQFPFQR